MELHHCVVGAAKITIHQATFHQLLSALIVFLISPHLNVSTVCGISACSFLTKDGATCIRVGAGNTRYFEKWKNFFYLYLSKNRQKGDRRDDSCPNFCCHREVRASRWQQPSSLLMLFPCREGWLRERLQTADPPAMSTSRARRQGSWHTEPLPER